MATNQAADAWGSAQATARALTEDLVAGDYLTTWDDDDAPGEMVVHEAKAALQSRGLRLVSDDRGLRVQAEEIEADDETMTIEQIGDLCDRRGVPIKAFWTEAMGGDMAALPRRDVEWTIHVLTDNDSE